MIRYVARRLLTAVLVLLITLFVTFMLMRGIGGTPFYPAEGYSIPLYLQRELTAYYHLDRSWPVQFATYLWHILRFDFGPTLSYRDQTVTAVIHDGVPVSLELAGLAIALALALGLPLGLASTLRRGGALDVAATTISTVLLATPVFLFAEIGRDDLIMRWNLGELGWSGARSAWLPVVTLALAPAGYVARLVRAGAVETLSEDYVRFARAKGLRRLRVLLVHVLPNSLTPFLSAAVPTLALLVTSAFFVERVYQVPGAADAFITAAERRDYPLVLGLTAVLAAVVVLASLLADVLAAALDVRLREDRR